LLIDEIGRGSLLEANGELPDNGAWMGAAVIAIPLPPRCLSSVRLLEGIPLASSDLGIVWKMVVWKDLVQAIDLSVIGISDCPGFDIDRVSQSLYRRRQHDTWEICERQEGRVPRSRFRRNWELKLTVGI
jgi:hypothetical protein